MRSALLPHCKPAAALRIYWMRPASNQRSHLGTMVRSNHKLADGKPLRLLIFDLDGTLIDSRLDLVNSVNATLRHFQRPELPPEVIATYVGDGAPMLMRRALGDPTDEAFLAEALEYFL